MTNKELIDLLERQEYLRKEQWIQLLSSWEESDRAYAQEKAVAIAKKHFGNGIFLRGLIEFSNYCKNDCLYCGIRRSNKKVRRYRLTKKEILASCQKGYKLGFRTFVLQSGEDPYYTDEIIVDLIRAIKEAYPDCALTLSLGERSRQAYQDFFEAGTDRYLLRHETANPVHYATLHPPGMELETRLRCLRDLKEIGFQTGCGFMVGAPGQTAADLAEDFLFIQELAPHMIGIGPFIPHRDTPLGSKSPGALELTLFLLSLLRIGCKNVLLPSTTALGTIHPYGLELGIQAGANVVMFNLTPTRVRGDYLLYDNKICIGEEAEKGRVVLEKKINSIGYCLVEGRGDWEKRKA
ncbi:MAG: [FeFe] hydrogenase H-cluster radical SAM maturase HydE [Desulfitobacteriia bacterium]